MPTFFNPAANLTADRIPIAAGGGRLTDDGELTWNSADKRLKVREAQFDRAGALSAMISPGYWSANHLTIARPAGADNGALYFALAGALTVDRAYGANLAVYSPGNNYYNVGLSYLNAGAPEIAHTGGPLAFNRSGSRYGFIDSAGVGVVASGTTSNYNNGAFQTGAFTAANAGYGFYDFALYRSGAGAARLTASLTADGGFIGSGASLTALNASNLGSGTVPDARLSANVALLASANTFTNAQTVAKAGANPARFTLNETGTRAWSLEASGGDLNIGSADNNGGVVFSTGISTTAGRPVSCGGDFTLGSAGNERWLYDCNGAVILKKRSATVPATLADVIAVLQYHGLCS